MSQLLRTASLSSAGSWNRGAEHLQRPVDHSGFAVETFTPQPPRSSARASSARKFVQAMTRTSTSGASRSRSAASTTVTLGLTIGSLHAQTCGNPGGQLAGIAREHGDASRTTRSERDGDDVEHPDRGAPVMSDRSRPDLQRSYGG